MHAKSGVIHGIRLKAVKSFQLFKPSDIVQQSDKLRQIGIFPGEAHPPADLTTAVDHPIGMNDFQADLIV